MSYKDKTWCASPNCVNECGRKMTNDDKVLAAALGQDRYMSYAYFCGVPSDMPFTQKLKEKINATLVRLVEHE